jgi:transcriptional regulator with XRE-family HTH domain
MSTEAKTLRLRVAANVRALRTLRALTQEQCAEACSIDRTLLQRLEAGTTNFTSTTLVLLCTGLRCDVSALFSFVADANPRRPPGRPRRTTSTSP